MYGGIKVTTHDFQKSLKKSHAAEDLPFWLEAYRAAFPTMRAMVNHREDGDHQRAGIDRSIVLENSKQILIDEKVRYRNSNGQVYTDIALEYLSDQARGTPGWVCKPLLCDYIAYAIAPLGICYLLPVTQLQSAWVNHGEQWISKYFSVVAQNKSNGNYWKTISVAVPAGEVFKAIGQCLRVRFIAYEGT